MATRVRMKKRPVGKRLMPGVHELPFAEADARAFVTVARAGSFTSAASLLAMTPSAVSKSISRLELALGVRLIARTTRSLHLTEEGMAFRERCERAFDLLNEAAEDASAGTRAISGTVRLGLPPLFGTFFLPHVLPALLAEHPRLRVEIVSTMRLADLQDRRLDVAIAVGALPDSSFTARPLGYGQFVTCAAPRYLERAGVPQSPDELAHHRLLTWLRPDGREAPWIFCADAQDGEAHEEALVVEGHVRSDDMHHLGAMACAGLGLANLPLFVVAHELEAGRLRRVLREHEPAPKLASLVYPAGRATPRRVRVLIESLLAQPAAMPGVSPPPTSAGTRTARPKG